jgi:hypothetical protein
MLRHERKFVVESGRASQAAVATLLRLHPALFSEIHQERWVNSLYYDTVDRKHYHASEIGLAERTKIRVRWYGALEDAHEAALEIKSKSDAVGHKQRFALPGDTTLAALLDPVGAAAVMRSAAVPESVQVRLGGLYPDVVTRYRRRYWRAACGRFRITVDTDLAFRRVGPGGLDAGSREVATAVIEVKYAVEHDAAARNVMQFFRMRMGKKSKYVTGMQRLNTV